MAKNQITIFEHERIDLEEQGIFLTKKDVSALEKLNASFYKEKKIEPIDLKYRRGKLVSIKAKNYVGVIKVRNKSFQIIPKLSQKTKGSEEYSRQAVRNLLFILTFTKKIKIKDFELAGLNKVNDDFFETLIYLFSQNLLNLAKNNINKEYIKLEDNLNFLKGKINFPNNIKKNVISGNKFYVSYEEFCEDNLLNQIFKFTTISLLKTTKNNRNAKILQELSFLLDDVTLKRITIDDFQKVKIDRLNNHYEPILNLAKIFITNSSLEIRSDNINTFTFIFDMNELFEEFIAELTKKIFFGTEHIVKTQHLAGHLVVEKDGKNVKLFRMLPDIKIFKEEEERPFIIVDTKYKIPELDVRGGVRQNDMYQMFAYSKKTLCPHVILLYPRLDDQDQENIHFKSEEGVNIYKKTINLCRELKLKEERAALIEELKDIYSVKSSYY